MYKQKKLKKFLTIGLALTGISAVSLPIITQYTTTLNNTYTTTNLQSGVSDNQKASKQTDTQVFENELLKDVWNKDNVYGTLNDRQKNYLNTKLLGAYLDTDGTQKVEYTNGSYLINNEISNFVLENLTSDVNDISLYNTDNNLFSMLVNSQEFTTKTNRLLFENLIVFQMINNIEKEVNSFVSIYDSYKDTQEIQNQINTNSFYGKILNDLKSNNKTTKTLSDKFWILDVIKNYKSYVNNTSDSVVGLSLFLQDVADKTYQTKDLSNKVDEFDNRIGNLLLGNLLTLDLFFNAEQYGDNLYTNANAILSNVFYQQNEFRLPVAEFTIYGLNTFNFKDKSVSLENSFYRQSLTSDKLKNYLYLDNTNLNQTNNDSGRTVLYKFYWFFKDNTFTDNLKPAYNSTIDMSKFKLTDTQQELLLKAFKNSNSDKQINFNNGLTDNDKELLKPILKQFLNVYSWNVSENTVDNLIDMFGLDTLIELSWHKITVESNKDTHSYEALLQFNSTVKNNNILTKVFAGEYYNPQTNFTLTRIDISETITKELVEINEYTKQIFTTHQSQGKKVPQFIYSIPKDNTGGDNNNGGGDNNNGGGNNNGGTDNNKPSTPGGDNQNNKPVEKSFWEENKFIIIAVLVFVLILIMFITLIVMSSQIHKLKKDKKNNN